MAGSVGVWRQSLGLCRSLKGSDACIKLLVCDRSLHQRIISPGARILLQGGVQVDTSPPPPQNIFHRGAKSKKASKKDKDDRKDSELSDVDLSRVCAGLNYFKKGEDPPIKKDSEYPAWLWTIAEPVKPLKELSPDTKEYWRRFNKIKARENNLLKQQMRRFFAKMTERLRLDSKEQFKSKKLKRKHPSQAPVDSTTTKNLPAAAPPPQYDSIFISSLSGSAYNSKSSSSANKQNHKLKLVKKKKNRLGQRARQRQWKELYGAHAKHLTRKRKAEAESVTKNSSCSSKLSREPRVKKGESVKKPNESLHPSWEASRKKKEQESKLSSFQGQRTVFSDDSD